MVELAAAAGDGHYVRVCVCALVLSEKRESTKEAWKKKIRFVWEASMTCL